MYKLLFSKQSEKIIKAYSNILLLMKCYEYPKNDLFDYTLKQSKTCHHNITYVKSWTCHLYKNNNRIIYTNKDTEKDPIACILKQEGELTAVNYMRLREAWDLKKHYMNNEEGDLFVTLDSLIELNSIIAGKKNNRIRITNVKPAGYNCIYMHYNNIHFALQILIDNYNDRRIIKTESFKRFLEIHPFEDGNGRTVKILFV